MNLDPRLEADATGWLARRDPRARILSAVVFALVVSSLNSLISSLLALLLSTAMIPLVGLRIREQLRRLLGLQAFMLVLLITLPFSVPGQSLGSLGPWVISLEGVEAAWLIIVKANAVVLVLLALVGTLPPVVFGHALGRLAIPEKFVHLLLMTMRQITVVQDEYTRLRRAMRARAFVACSNRHTWNSYGQLMGMLLIRSIDRSNRILEAMRCRGFSGRLYLLDDTSWETDDTRMMIFWSAGCMGIVLLDLYS